MSTAKLWPAEVHLVSSFSATWQTVVMSGSFSCLTLTTALTSGFQHLAWRTLQIWDTEYTHGQFGEDVGSSSNANTNHTLHPDHTHTHIHTSGFTDCLDALRKYLRCVAEKVTHLLKLWQDRRQHLSQLIHGGVLVPAHTHIHTHISGPICWSLRL